MSMKKRRPWLTALLRKWIDGRCLVGRRNKWAKSTALFDDWLDWLDHLPPDERPSRGPHGKYMGCGTLGVFVPALKALGHKHKHFRDGNRFDGIMLRGNAAKHEAEI